MADIVSGNKMILAQLLVAHRRSCKIISAPVSVMLIIFSLAALSASIVFICKTAGNKGSPTFTSYAVAAGTLSALWVILGIAAVVNCCRRKFYTRKLHKIFDQTIEPIVWRLDGDEWIKYLEYIYGPNRTFPFKRSGSLWCCRCRKFTRLSNRGYGYIIFVENAIIINELFLYRLNKMPINGSKLVTLANQQLALRIHFQPHGAITNTNQAHTVNTISRDIDLFIPKAIQEPRQRLDQMIELMNPQPNNVQNIIPNFNEIRALFSSLQP